MTKGLERLELLVIDVVDIYIVNTLDEKRGNEKMIKKVLSRVTAAIAVVTMGMLVMFGTEEAEAATMKQWNISKQNIAAICAELERALENEDFRRDLYLYSRGIEHDYNPIDLMDISVKYNEDILINVPEVVLNYVIIPTFAKCGADIEMYQEELIFYKNILETMSQKNCNRARIYYRYATEKNEWESLPDKYSAAPYYLVVSSKCVVEYQNITTK